MTQKENPYILQSSSVQIPLMEKYGLTFCEGRVLGHIRFVLLDKAKRRHYYYSNKQVSEACGISYSAASRAMVTLKEKELIVVSYFTKKGGGRGRKVELTSKGSKRVKRGYNKKTRKISNLARKYKKDWIEGNEEMRIRERAEREYSEDTFEGLFDRNWLFEYAKHLSAIKLSGEENEYVLGNSPYCVQAQELYALTITESHVYGLITFILGGKNRCSSFYFTNKDISKSLKISLRAVASAVKKLQDIGLISIKKSYNKEKKHVERKISLTQKSIDETWYTGTEVERSVRFVQGSIFRDKKNFKILKSMIKTSSIPPIKKKKKIDVPTDLERKLLKLYGEKVIPIPKSYKSRGYLKSVRKLVNYANDLGLGEKEILLSFHQFLGSRFHKESVKKENRWRIEHKVFFGCVEKGLKVYYKNIKNDKKTLAIGGRDAGSRGVRHDEAYAKAWKKRAKEQDRINFELDKEVYANLPKERQEFYGGWEGFSKRYRDLYGWV